MFRVLHWRRLSFTAGKPDVRPLLMFTFMLGTVSVCILAPVGSASSVERPEIRRVNLSSCLREDGHMDVFVNDQHLFFHHSGASVSAPSMTCTVAVSTSQGKRLLVEVLGCPVRKCVYRNYIRVSHGGPKSKTWQRCDWSMYSSHRVTGPGRKAELGLIAKDAHRDYCVRIRVTALAAELEVVRLSPTLGYIQTAANDIWKPYLDRMDVWKHIYPPQDHVTLLSTSRMYLEVDMCYDFLEVFSGGRARGENRLWKACGVVPPPLKLLDTREISVHFYSDNFKHFMGFRLMFSYHPKPHQLMILSGLWNCSVPAWPDFQRHFLCNFNVECAGGEDEAVCSYSGHCGLHFLTLENRCFSYVSSKHQLSWEDASIECMDRGGYLASLNTPQEWTTVSNALRNRQSPKQVYVGLKETSSALPSWYSTAWQWMDGVIAYYISCMYAITDRCGVLSVDTPDSLETSVPCHVPQYSDFLCEFDSRGDLEHHPEQQEERRLKESSQITVKLSVPAEVTLAVPYVECPAGHLTRDFLACDERSACWSSRSSYVESAEWGTPSRASCPAPLTSLPAMFQCSSSFQQVPYHVVCDHRQQCSDGSDERHCVFRPCSGSTPLQCSSSLQCVGRDAFCDKSHDCADDTDESGCYFKIRRHCKTIPPPAILNTVNVSYCSLFSYDSIDSHHEPLSAPCPPTHFQCPDRYGLGYCLPVFFRCNGIKDCPGQQDEADCDVFACPGFYRCRNSLICLHVSFVCDGIYHCPEQDDDLYCHSLPCPHNCTCHGLAFVCHGTFEARSHPELRYLNAKGSGIDVDQLSENTMLVHLSLANCGLQIMDDLSFPNIRSLDLSDNLLSVISAKHLRGVANLQFLILSGNPFTAFFPSDSNVTFGLYNVELIELSWVTLKEINFSNFDSFPKLRTLNLSHSTTRALNPDSKESFRNLQVFDLSHCPLNQFPLDVLSTLSDLEIVLSENYKLCCTVVLPAMFNAKNCHARLDPVSSCDHLLSSTAHKVMLALCSSFALLGNIVSVGVRVFVQRRSGAATSKDVLVTHLALGDVAMGLCVAVVAVADRLYQGKYVLEDLSWRRSAACKTVGFLFLLSSQVCVFMVFLVTVDRLLALFSKAREPSCKSAHVMSVVVWIWCTVVAVLPLVPTTADWKVFGQTAACFPLLVRKPQFGEDSDAASFTAAFLVVVFLLESATAISQICIYSTFQDSDTATVTKTTASVQLLTPPSKLVAMTSEVSDARLVFSSCVLNVSCWLLLCALAVLAGYGSPFPDELHVHVGMITMPLASALRPLLYALGVSGERRRRERAERLIAHVVAQRRKRVQNTAKATNREE